MKYLNMLAFVLIIIGALNWGLWGFFQFDIVAWLFKGNTTWLSRLIYSVVGLAGVWSLLRLLPRCKHLCCDTGCSTKGGKTGKGGCCN